MSLQIWLSLNGDLKNNGLLGNTVITNHGATIDNNGKIGKCYAFDNNTSYISIQHNQLYKILNGSSQPMSICFWVFHADTTRAIIFGDYAVTGGNNFNIELATNHTLRWYWSSPDIGISAMNVGLNTWTHVAFTYNGAILKGYINGVEKYSNTVVLNAKNRSSGEYYIGRDNRTGTTTLNGKLNDFRIYDHCLSDKEVKEIAKGLVLHYKLNNNSRGNPNLIPNTSPNEVQYTYPSGNTYNDKFAATTSIIPSASQYILSFDAKSTVAGDKVRAHYYNPNTTTRCETNQGIITTATDGNIDFTLSTQWEHYWVIYTQSNTTAVKRIIFPRMFGPDRTEAAKGSGIVSIKNLKFEEGTVSTIWQPNSNDSLYTSFNFNNIIYDSSGYNNNGEIINTITIDANSPRYKAYTHFSATNQKIKIPGLSTTGFSNSYTFAWWEKISSTSPMHWGFSDGVRLNGMYTGRLWNTGDGSNNPLYNPGTTTQVAAPSVNIWHHWVMTGDGTKCLVYQDGVLWAEAKTYKTITGTTIYINGWDTNTNYSSDNASISDFRIYATTLTADQIKKLYKTSKIIDGTTVKARDLEVST